MQKNLNLRGTDNGLRIDEDCRKKFAKIREYEVIPPSSIRARDDVICTKIGGYGRKLLQLAQRQFSASFTSTYLKRKNKNAGS